MEVVVLCGGSLDAFKSQICYSKALRSSVARLDIQVTHLDQFSPEGVERETVVILVCPHPTKSASKVQSILEKFRLVVTVNHEIDGYTNYQHLHAALEALANRAAETA